jgi:hypothetical protein
MPGDTASILTELGRLLGVEHVLDPPPRSPYNEDTSHRTDMQGRADAVALPVCFGAARPRAPTSARPGCRLEGLSTRRRGAG